MTKGQLEFLKKHDAKIKEENKIILIKALVN